MNTVIAKIVSISGRTAMVDVGSVPVCPRCAAGKGCGAGLFGANAGAITLNVELPASGAFNAGESVRLAIPSSRLLRASMLAYGLPLLGALSLTMFGWLIVQPLSDAAAALFAMSGLLIGFFVGRRRLKKESCARQFQLEILTGSVVEGP